MSVIDGGEARLHRAITGVSMRALEFWKVVTVDKSGFLDRMVGLLGEHSATAWWGACSERVRRTGS